MILRPHPHHYPQSHERQQPHQRPHPPTHKRLHAHQDPHTRPHWLARLQWAVVLAMWWCVVPTVSGQFGLVAPALSSLRTSPGMLSSSLGTLRAGGAPRLLTQLGERPPLPRRSASTRESEIAAIFRGVAYGAPTQGSNTTTTLTTTAAPSTPRAALTTPARMHQPFRMESATEVTGGSVRLVRLQQSTATAAVAGGDELSYILHDTSNVSDESEAPQRHSDATFAHTRDDTTTVATTTTTSVDGAGGGLPQRDMTGVRWWLGAAWWVHVYVSAGLLALLAAAALCCLARPASPLLLPRPHHLAIHTFVFLAATLRSLRLFHDPYGVERRLPEAAAAALEEASWPCLTAALAVLVVTVARAGHQPPPPRPHASIVLGLLTALHLVVSVSAHTAARLLPRHALSLRVVAQAVTATWGGGVGGSGLWAAWRTECSGGQQRRHLLARASRWGGAASGNSGLKNGLRLALVASVAQILLAILQLYMLVVPVTPAAHVWAWWVRMSMARGLELLVGVAVVTATGLLARGRPPASRRDSAIFSVLTSCGRDGRPVKGGRSANVFPATSEKQHILGSFSLRPGDQPLHHSLKRPPLEWQRPTQLAKVPAVHSVTSDFQLLWNRDRTQSAIGFRPSSMLVNDSGFVRFRTQVDPEQPMDEVFQQSSLLPHKAAPASCPKTHHTYSSQTLPASRYYCGPVTSVSSPERSPIRNPIRAQTLRWRRPPSSRGGRIPPPTHHPPPPVTSASRYDMQTFDDYEVASYYHHSGSVSGGSHVYSTPHSGSPRPHFLTPARRRDPLPSVHGGRPQQEEAGEGHPADGLSGLMEPSTCSSLSEIHVDYLTDVSSSNDAVNLGSLPYHAHRPRPHLNTLTLPLTSSLYPHVPPPYSTPAHSTSAGGASPSASQQPDITPDSAVVLDYSTSAEEEADGHEQPSDPARLSEAGKGPVGSRSGLLSKLVGSSMSVTRYGYSPLDMDDTSSPSQEAPAAAATRVRRVASSSNLQETSERPRPAVMPRPPDIVTSL
ncbi:uncharacterized protein [Panulirus ornatus]|uniref:uncharacterized protein n=1 Tax=Panulirus ornatus TaxID=150431 RepID=UPI003A897D48